MAKVLANLRQFMNIIRRNTMVTTLDEIWVITCWVNVKKEQKLIKLMSSQDNAIAMSCDPVITIYGDPVSVSFKHVYYFQFLIFEIISFVVWFYILDVTFPRLLIFCFANLYLKIIEVFVQQNVSQENTCARVSFLIKSQAGLQCY